MRLHYRDDPEKIKKLAGMRARITRCSTCRLGNEPGQETDLLCTIIGLSSWDNIRNVVQVRVGNNFGSYWWIDVELDPDNNY